jgi:hypothetical protein
VTALATLPTMVEPLPLTETALLNARSGAIVCAW